MENSIFFFGCWIHRNGNLFNRWMIFFFLFDLASGGIKRTPGRKQKGTDADDFDLAPDLIDTRRLVSFLATGLLISSDSAQRHRTSPFSCR